MMKTAESELIFLLKIFLQIREIIKFDKSAIPLENVRKKTIRYACSNEGSQKYTKVVVVRPKSFV